MDVQVSLQAHTCRKTTFSILGATGCVSCISIDVNKEWTDGHLTCVNLGWVAKRNPKTQVFNWSLLASRFGHSSMRCFDRCVVVVIFAYQRNERIVGFAKRFKFFCLFFVSCCFVIVFVCFIV